MELVGYLLLIENIRAGDKSLNYTTGVSTVGNNGLV
jgi:hypothetical protein